MQEGSPEQVAPNMVRYAYLWLQENVYAWSSSEEYVMAEAHDLIANIKIGVDYGD